MYCTWAGVVWLEHVQFSVFESLQFKMSTSSPVFTIIRPPWLSTVFKSSKFTLVIKMSNFCREYTSSIYICKYIAGRAQLLSAHSNADRVYSRMLDWQWRTWTGHWTGLDVQRRAHTYIYFCTLSICYTTSGYMLWKCQFRNLNQLKPEEGWTPQRPSWSIRCILQI